MFYGDAIMNFNGGKGAEIAISDKASFKENMAAKSGGAISNYYGKVTIGEEALFEKNRSGTSGGAIATYTYSDGYVGDFSIADQATFKSNEAQENGGILTIVTPDDAQTTFTGNSANVDGAVSNHSTGTVDLGSNVLFSSNHALWAGAIFNQRATLTLGDNVKFVGNYSTGAADGSGVTTSNYGDGGMGGAIMNQSDNKNSAATFKIGANSYFEGNRSEQSSGGAIANYRHTTTGNAEIDTVSMTIGAGAQFISNTAACNL